MLACADDVPTLESFAYGDTPTEEALAALVDEVLGAGDSFAVALTELSGRLDIRPLVLRTALTYLELAGVLRQGTPFYAAYELRPSLDPAEIAARFEGERARFVTALFAAAKKGRTCYAIDPGALARTLGEPRDRIVRALEYFEQQGWAELRASEVRQRYQRLRPAEDAAALATELGRRFSTREAQEIARVREIVELVTHDGCQVNALVAHFGEARPAPCGHCTHCLTGVAQTLIAGVRPPPLPAEIDVGALQALCSDHPAALGHPRQMARFLCALGSPALTRARLARHPLFGACEGRRFDEVMAWWANARA
jgi:ATP-dependent DNA helicase RecQ